MFSHKEGCPSLLMTSILIISEAVAVLIQPTQIASTTLHRSRMHGVSNEWTKASLYFSDLRLRRFSVFSKLIPTVSWLIRTGHTSSRSRFVPLMYQSGSVVGHALLSTHSKIRGFSKMQFFAQFWSDLKKKERIWIIRIDVGYQVYCQVTSSADVDS